jgi:hypothetical protein
MIVKKRGRGIDGIFTFYSEAFIHLRDNYADLRYIKNTIANEGVLQGETGLQTGRQRDWVDMPMSILRSGYTGVFDEHYAEHCAELDLKLLEEV